MKNIRTFLNLTLLCLLSFFITPAFSAYTTGDGSSGGCGQNGYMVWGRTGCVTGTACNQYAGMIEGADDTHDVMCKSSDFDSKNRNAECSPNSNGSITCTCNAGSRQNSSTGLSTTTYSCDNGSVVSNDIWAYALGAGMFGGGVSAAATTCSVGAVIPCIASAITALAGAGIMAVTGSPEDAAASQNICATQTCISVQLDPNTPLTGDSNAPAVTTDDEGNFTPVGNGWTSDGDGRYNYNSLESDGTTTTTTVDTNIDRVTSTTTYSNGSSNSASVQSTGDGKEVVTGSSQSSDHTYNTAQELNNGTPTGTGAENYTGNVPTGGLSSGSSSGGSGSGSGSGTGSGGSGEEGGGDCFEYGCSLEETQLDVLAELQDTYYDEAQDVQDDLHQLGDNGINDVADRMKNMLDEFMEDSGIDDLFDEATDNLPIKDLIESSSGSCSTSFIILGQSYEYSYCEFQPQVHEVIAFFMFIALSFGITALVFERPQGG